MYRWCDCLVLTWSPGLMHVLSSGLQSQADPVYGLPDIGDVRHWHCPSQVQTPLSLPVGGVKGFFSIILLVCTSTGLTFTVSVTLEIVAFAVYTKIFQVALFELLLLLLLFIVVVVIYFSCVTVASSTDASSSTRAYLTVQCADSVYH